MSPFHDTEDLQAELQAFLEAFVESEAGSRAAQCAQDGGLDGVLVLRTVNPDGVVCLDVPGRRVMTASGDEVAVELELDAGDLHDLLLNRLGPVEISQLYETDRVRFAGRPQALGAVAVLAGELQPFYPDSLANRGRDDLLGTPAPEIRTVWDVDGPPREVIGKRRPWQRPKKSADAL
jgi:hypothetical protein